MRSIIAWSLVTALSLAACAGTGSSEPSPEAADAGSPSASPGGGGLSAGVPVDREPIRLVTLGDGYTEGFRTSAPGRDSWPSQLVEAMKRSGIGVVLWNLAQQSHTSDLVVEEQLGLVSALEPDVVTVQVGANDVIARDTASYRLNLEIVFDELLDYLPPEHIFAITTPDHSLTTWGRSLPSGEDAGEAVRTANRTLEEVAAERGITVIDISSVNTLAAADPSLVIDEGPYGTPKQYAGWVEIIGSHILAAIASEEP